MLVGQHSLDGMRQNRELDQVTFLSQQQKLKSKVLGGDDKLHVLSMGGVKHPPTHTRYHLTQFSRELLALKSCLVGLVLIK